MKMYANHKFNLIEDDELVSSTNNTDIVCLLLTIIAILLVIFGVIFITSQAKAEAKTYAMDANQELKNLMDFNGGIHD